MPKHLTDAQVAHFREHGYVFPLRAMDAAEADRYRQLIENYEATIGEDANRSLKIKGHLAYPALVELGRNPRILDAVEDLIGPNILLFGASLFAKNARNPSYVSWHQDSAYFGLTPHEEVTAWVGFTHADAENGCLRVLPGSHTGPDRRHVETFAADNMLAKGQTLTGIDDSLAVEMPVAAGEFSLHHERTAHCSLPNRSHGRRIGFAYFFIPTHVKPLKGRHRATLVRGVDAYGHWDADVLPAYDLDPAAMAQLRGAWGQYKDGETRQVADMAP
ncbi:phytanoyl-CoA dioxygenase family protein [Azoarcus indigens]|uniref:Ectoine hydroxylase-related dioxygenase (Phytanoyl-CoA dioxygenase family) n=1 Tax=Azoarcus indigens TaxID=29545 RepID=A0A4R6DH00_9RHOO|nr:phytanoyl-CoA dioxygenase family protein [Azoarcus indigens]NMG66059.1 phytanoyl-CoA dioxygenase family protein [Azoarcus indigens]TDN43820.1 ectoine hydroxylase-related dioxygenase (phytanoyl-CoA dioxygenase family) [Azoarcus indigens]